jgi:hypothetical protein
MRQYCPHAVQRLGMLLAVVVFVSLSWPPAVHAVMDIDDSGPLLRDGGFRARATNVGIFGNAFLDQGRSFDPSFEFPAYSGNECLNYAALWVGAVNQDGVERVSGGPLLEWRPTLAQDDRVRERSLGDPGTYRMYDDDGDGHTDEEILNGRDDDGDGLIDEDLGLPASQVLASDYTDDEQAAINFVYPTGERHVPLGLSVHEEDYAWDGPEYRGVAGLDFEITNHGTLTLRNVYVGLFADLDARLRDDRVGHLNDRVARRGVQTSVHEGEYTVTVGGGNYVHDECFANLTAGLTVVSDGRAGSELPVIGIMGLDHTTDPLALISSAAGYARAPGRVSFQTSIMVNPVRTATGLVPITDADRYAALTGSWPQAGTDHQDDYVTLLRCGPFARLAPGQTITVDAALIAASTVDSLIDVATRLLYLHRGRWMNMLPDSLPLTQTEQLRSGATGTFGHEACVEAPPGVSFVADADCVTARVYIVNDLDPIPPLAPRMITYTSGTCVWTNADCEPCTPPVSGAETLVHWLPPSAYLPSPNVRVTPGDHRVTIAWDNLPQVLLAGGTLQSGSNVFRGYRLYRVADWRARVGELPPRSTWELLAAFTVQPDDTLLNELSLASITDTTLAYKEILYEQPVFPIGRYAYVDPLVHNGFDYAYAVTSVYDTAPVAYEDRVRIRSLESPFTVGPDQSVIPHAAARADPSAVWVVPNPFRGSADWDRRPTLGDPLTRHIDFMGLPRARCTIKVWTLAGDLVARIDHDGSGGDGEASWDLVSRSGQDVASGIYLFTVDSTLGHKVGRFVVIR